MNRRQALEALRAGPALVRGFPGDAVDLDGLLAHLIARGLEGGVHLANQELEGVVWVRDGAPRDAWLFEARGGGAVPVGDNGHDFLRRMAARGAILSVYIGIPQETGLETVAPPAEPQRPAVVASVQVAATPRSAVSVEPTPRPWPLILEGTGERIARHRGQRLAARFLATLASTLRPYGGVIEGTRVVAPAIPEMTWRIIVETACAPIVAVAGRAFVDRTIAAAERDVLAAGGRSGTQG